jgi:hypothetical protein
MNTRAADVLSGVIESSFVVRATRGVAIGRVLIAWLVAARQWGRRTDARIIVGLGGAWTAEKEARQAEALRAIAADSWLVSLLESWIGAVPLAWQGCLVRRAFGGTIELDLCKRTRLAGWALVAAVITHVVFLLLCGMTVGWIGWSTRIALLAFGLALCWKPATWASAWMDRAATPREG